MAELSVDAYLVEWQDNGDCLIVEAYDLGDIELGHVGGIPRREAIYQDERVNVLSSLHLYRSIDHGLRTADGTALEVIGEVCETIVAPVLRAMCAPIVAENHSYTDPVDHLAAINSVRGEYGWEAGRDFEPWDESGWTPDSWFEDEPLFGQGCEQDMCEDTWNACGGVVWSDADCGMTWMYVTLEDYTR